MTNNTLHADALNKDVECIARAQKRLKKAYLRHVSWRGVAGECGVKVRYVWALVQRGTVPKNPDIRAAIYLPRVMPSEKKPRVRHPFVPLGAPGWEEYYFKKVKR
jgi:hypothetical protein